ncbi:Creatinase/aminopeptidase [Mucidula mucida]|nr:Creatinase/aminopeptidase [Mucidula mucida]
MDSGNEKSGKDNGAGDRRESAPRISPSRRNDSFSWIILVLAAVAFLVNIGDLSRRRNTETAPPSSSLDLDFPEIKGYCSNTLPIAASEFHQRQSSLAKVLHSLNASAYIAEPGASAAFYGNLSTSNWWLSERPLLLIVTPESTSGEVAPKVSVLTPKFETTRAKMLPIPFNGTVEYTEWREEVNPYERVAPMISSTSGTIFVDGTIRHFIVDGLQKAFPLATIVTAPLEIRQLRERKSEAELGLMKCANEATLLSIREVRKKLFIGIRESQARKMIAAALKSTGLSDGECLTLFGENAALPHGSGTDRALGVSDFALFDCTASLHGYGSDVTRTVALDVSKIPLVHRAIWNHVHGAQNTAFQTAKAGAVAKEVDRAARLYLSLSGNDKYFTHRLGHGIGLEVHEDPYLNGGSETILQTGHAFSDEPGVYIEGKVGVRLEDCFYIAEDGKAVYLTAGVGGAAESPVSP